MHRKDIYQKRAYAAQRTMKALHRLSNESAKQPAPSADMQAIRWMKAWSLVAFAHVPLHPKDQCAKAKSQCSGKIHSLAERATTTTEERL